MHAPDREGRRAQVLGLGLGVEVQAWRWVFEVQDSEGLAGSLGFGVQVLEQKLKLRSIFIGNASQLTVWLARSWFVLSAFKVTWDWCEGSARHA